MSSNVIAGEAFVKLTLESAALQEGLKRAQSELKSFGEAASAVVSGLKTVSLSVLPALGGMISKFANFDDAMRAVKGVTGATQNEFFGNCVRSANAKFAPDQFRRYWVYAHAVWWWVLLRLFGAPAYNYRGKEASDE